MAIQRLVRTKKARTPLMVACTLLLAAIVVVSKMFAD